MIIMITIIIINHPSIIFPHLLVPEFKVTWGLLEPALVDRGQRQCMSK